MPLAAVAKGAMAQSGMCTEAGVQSSQPPAISSGVLLNSRYARTGSAHRADDAPTRPGSVLPVRLARQDLELCVHRFPPIASRTVKIPVCTRGCRSSGVAASSVLPGSMVGHTARCIPAAVGNGPGGATSHNGEIRLIPSARAPGSAFGFGFAGSSRPPHPAHRRSRASPGRRRRASANSRSPRLQPGCRHAARPSAAACRCHPPAPWQRRLPA